MDATPTACPPTGRILDAAPLVHAVMKDAARAEGPEGPKWPPRRPIPASARRRAEGQEVAGRDVHNRARPEKYKILVL